jgi:hypothetical protein
MRPVWSGDWPIPDRLALPGCRVRVRLVPRGAPGLGDADATWQYRHEEGGAGSAVIRIDAALPLPVQRYCLLHELQHALVELLDVMLEKYLEHVHVKTIARAGAQEGSCDLLSGTSASGPEPSAA